MPNESIEIINPVANGRRSMSRPHAERYARQGRGEFVGRKQFRFFPKHRLHRAVIESAESKAGYDSRRTMLSRREMLAVPIIAPEKMLGPTGRLQPRGRSGRTKILVQNGVQK